MCERGDDIIAIEKKPTTIAFNHALMQYIFFRLEVKVQSPSASELVCKNLCRKKVKDQQNVDIHFCTIFFQICATIMTH
jgi:hypothetical protein